MEERDGSVQCNARLKTRADQVSFQLVKFSKNIYFQHFGNLERGAIQFLAKEGDGMLHYEEMLALTSERKRDRKTDKEGDTRGGLLSKLKRRVREHRIYER